MNKEPLKPIEICLGNIIECMGKVELVTGIMQESTGQFQIGHTGWNKGIGFVLPENVSFSTYPIPLTEEWKICLGIEKFDKLPDWIKYVHQVQNYFKWNLQMNLLEIMNWDLLPSVEGVAFGE